MPKKNSQVWFFTVDAGRARLLSCRSVPPGRLHVDESDALEYVAEDHEHGRPSPRTGKAGNSYASGGHEEEHQIHRFAKEVSSWIEAKLRELPGHSIALFSAPRFLGELRKLIAPDVIRRLDAQALDLSGLTPGSLAGHPSIEKLYSDSAV